MAHALQLHFDRHADAAVRAMWANLEARGLGTLATRSHARHRPHVSLLVAEHISVAQARHASQPALEGIDLTLELGSLSVFPGRSGVLYLGVVPTLAILRLHHGVHQRSAGAGIETDRHYLPDVWVPHCTLAQGLDHDEIAAGVHALKRLRPLSADVAEVALVDIETGATTPLAEPHRSANDE